MTLSPVDLHQEQNSRQLYRLDSIKDCKGLLQSLDEGIYTIGWEGVLPHFKNCEADINRDKKIKIKVEHNVDLGNILKLKKPALTKKIEICDEDVACFEEWATEQIVELNSKLVWILNGVYADEAN